MLELRERMKMPNTNYPSQTQYLFCSKDHRGAWAGTGQVGRSGGGGEGRTNP